MKYLQAGDNNYRVHSISSLSNITDYQRKLKKR